MAESVTIIAGTYTYRKRQTSSKYTDGYNSKIKFYNGCIDLYYDRKKDYNEFKKKVKSWEDYLPSLNSLAAKFNLLSTLTSLSLSNFLNGGYICDGKALRGDELYAILNSLSSVKNPTDIYNDSVIKLDEHKKTLENKKQDCLTFEETLSDAETNMEMYSPKLKEE